MATTIIKKKAPASKKGKTLSKTTKAATKKAVAKKVAKKAPVNKADATKAPASKPKAQPKGKSKVASKTAKKTAVKTTVAQAAPRIGMDRDAGYEAIKSALWHSDRALHKKATMTKGGMTFPVNSTTWAFIAHPDDYKPGNEDGWVVGWTYKSNKVSEIEEGFVFGSRTQVRTLIAEAQRMFKAAEKDQES